MYGMVNKAMEDMVRRGHGDAAWEDIKARAGVEIDMFLGDEPYPDDMTYRLVDAAREVLGATADEILVAFGRHWIAYTAEEGYGPLMSAAGRTIPEFFASLPDFHSRIAMIFPRLQPPRFLCTDVTPTSLRLHYVTHRRGFAPFVIGLLHGLGDRMGTPVRVVQAQARDAGADHDVFDVSWSPGG
ncbi:MAG: heme NO-binding domain-containing protein [Rhodospirillales bacterium]|jgi:hypothetical protein